MAFYDEGMKIFVSGQIHDLTMVRTVQAECIRTGHTITHDWTRNETGDKLLAGQAAKFNEPEEAARRAVKDTNGVIDCDAYIVCTSNESVGKGMYVELGAALALNVTTGSPRIYMLGDLQHASIFYFHPSIKRVASVTEILAELA